MVLDSESIDRKGFWRLELVQLLQHLDEKKSVQQVFRLGSNLLREWWAKFTIMIIVVNQISTFHQGAKSAHPSFCLMQSQARYFISKCGWYGGYQQQQAERTTKSPVNPQPELMCKCWAQQYSDKAFMQLFPSGPVPVWSLAGRLIYRTNIIIVPSPSLVLSCS